MKKHFLILVAFGALTLTGFAQQDNVDPVIMQKIRNEGLNNSQVMKTAFYLTDVSGPRLSNSPGLKRAQDWAVNTLKSYGLKNVKLEPWGKFGKGWQVEKNYVAMIAPYYHAIIATPKAWTPGTNGAVKSDVVIIDITKIDTILKMDPFKGKLKGKIVIFDSPASLAPTFRADANRYTEDELSKIAEPQTAQPARQGAGAGANANQMAQLRRVRAMRTQIGEFLKAEGAGLLLSMGRGAHGTLFTTNGASYAEDAAPVLPELEMSPEDYLRIVRLVKAGIKVELEADIKTQFFNNDLQGYNVIAEIPGTDKDLKDELVMLGGHLDSWHAATGATDNAAGCAVMMEAVRIIAAQNLNPKRTIRIALWSSEEQGLFGSRGYVANHFGNPRTMELKPEHEKVSAYYNLDNGTGKIRGIYLQGNNAAAPIFQTWLSPFKDLDATTITSRNTGGTDHLAFDAVGIPGFQFIQDGIDYNTRTHHSNMDTYDRLIADDLKQSATIIAALVYNTAQRQAKIPRKELPKAQGTN
ncbi:M28 family metallopeptidase [Daejeonella lutea]|uniref:Carboxypeptidase Q n=1 Tax=Daejeonella lutea TaxID=572036 RepID=A0A1T5D881_9SPHI|nr:M20/M25/M40 family metallo-hydrolase [Daejeonella lutea]SKB67879.1 Peptidase family M28 [Daejeonella lutea]